MSLGMKHNVYRKKVLKNIVQKYHVDLFVDVKEIIIDNTVVFCDGKYLC